MRFTTPRIRFGRTPAGDTTPTPRLERARFRRQAMLAEAAAVVQVLPAEGESLHAILTARFDMAHVLVALVDHLGGVEAARVATLSFNQRNLAELLTLLDSGRVKTLALLASKFFARHDKALWETTLAEFRARGQRAAAARSHCKVITLAAADGRRFVLEGSANLRSNGNVENLVVIQDATLHDWHAQWIDDLVAQHEGNEGRATATG